MGQQEMGAWTGWPCRDRVRRVEWGRGLEVLTHVQESSCQRSWPHGDSKAYVKQS